jgi:hypothetical protein
VFAPNSRYYDLPVLIYTGPDGRAIPYVSRRFAPQGADLPLLMEVTTTQDDRLDLIATRTLGDPEQSWRICDANDAMNPADAAGPPAARAGAVSAADRDGATAGRGDPVYRGRDEPASRFVGVRLATESSYMPLLGTYLTILIGPTIPVPAPPALTQAIRDVEVIHNDFKRSGFRITFWLGRAGQLGAMDYPLMQSALLQPFNRVILVVTLNAGMHVLMDGIITHHQVQPSNEPGGSTVQVMGEDISVLMDLEEKKRSLPPMSDTLVAGTVLAAYQRYGVTPLVTPAPDDNQPSAQHPPFQDGTDLRYVMRLARRYAYVFCILPGPVPGASRAYWGPQIVPGAPLPALSINLGPATNVDDVTFSYDALAPLTVSGQVLDPTTDSIRSIAAGTLDELVLSETSALTAQRKVRAVQFDPTSGMTYAQALERAQARVDAAANNTVVAEGQLDTLRYGNLLAARRLVGMRGAGASYDGMYYVKSVTHTLRVGAYRQSFTLLRQGVGTATTRVKP